MKMKKKDQVKTKGSRIYWLDNLRTFMIFLVVVFHVATIYEKNSMGADWWMVVDPSNGDFAGILFLILNTFVMAVIFFVSGYFAPLSLKNKSRWQFIKSKFTRLMIPWTIAVLTLMPLYKVIFLYSRNLPQADWTTYFHWSNGIFSQNWLWFLPALFLFNLLYSGFVKLDTSKINLKKSIWIMLGLGLAFSFCMDYFGLHGWTKTILLDFQNERIFIYFLAFIMGAQCYKLETFESDKRNKKLEIIMGSIGWIPITIYIAGIIFALISPDSYLISKVADTLIVRLSFVLSVAYMIYSMVTTFKSYFNKQGKIWKELNKNSYGVYIIHVIVMGGIALIMLNTEIPSILKFLILTVATFVVSNLIVSLFRKILKLIKLISKI